MKHGVATPSAQGMRSAPLDRHAPSRKGRARARPVRNGSAPRDGTNAARSVAPTQKNAEKLVTL
ncbi:hypothetical protein [Burkholderia cepacia]|uniref:hypothetical protein n=1 Tax=Burkholderia cepacia TaxID=292 RepID=UPI0021AB3CDD|nr:hypothetical protein [Burkholderia cepacia]